MYNLNYDQLDTLKTVLRFHGIEDDELVKRLEAFAVWIQDIERSKFDRNFYPALPLVFLSLQGIYGKGALEKKS